jgi:signal transduction histidine kinase
MMIPLRDTDPSGRVGTEGVLALAWDRDRDDAAEQVDVALPTAFAEQAALAIRMARSTTEGRRLAVYEDRDRIGRDLHDVVIQRLFALGLNLQGALRRVDDELLAGRLDEAIVEIDDTIRDIRRTIFQLGAMDRSGDLQTEITQLVERAASALKFRPTLAFEGAVRLRVGPAIVPDVLAVLAEALSNTTRHAGASRVSVLVRVDAAAVTLRVADDGRGIPADAAESGLANLRERAAKHGGACEIGAGDGGGTVVEWTVPLS